MFLCLLLKLLLAGGDLSGWGDHLLSGFQALTAERKLLADAKVRSRKRAEVFEFDEPLDDAGELFGDALLVLGIQHLLEEIFKELLELLAAEELDHVVLVDGDGVEKLILVDHLLQKTHPIRADRLAGAEDVFVILLLEPDLLELKAEAV